MRQYNPPLAFGKESAPRSNSSIQLPSTGQSACTGGSRMGLPLLSRACTAGKHYVSWTQSRQIALGRGSDEGLELTVYFGRLICRRKPIVHP
jgi:hypothetical protein